MNLHRRSFLNAAIALAATPLFGADQVPSAASLARAVPPTLLDALLIKDGDGTQLPLDIWRGKWLIVNLWAPWCLPCRREMPSLERLSARLDPEHAALIPLAFEWRGPIWVQKFYREEGISTLPIYLGDGENLEAVLGSANLPTTLILDPSGHHVFTVSGEATWDDPETLSWISGLGR